MSNICWGFTITYLRSGFRPDHTELHDEWFFSKEDAEQKSQEHLHEWTSVQVVPVERHVMVDNHVVLTTMDRQFYKVVEVDELE